VDILKDCVFLTELVKNEEFCLDSNLSMVLDRASNILGMIRKERRMNIDVLESVLRDASIRSSRKAGLIALWSLSAALECVLVLKLRTSI
jgi:allantoinase/DNA mismatch repair protein MutS2